MSDKYFFTEIVEKVYKYSRTNLPMTGDYALAKIIEENRIKCHGHLHNVYCHANTLKDELNGSINLYAGQVQLIESCQQLNSRIELINRTKEYLFVSLKEILAPVWRVYWSESCFSYSTIIVWLNKADQDNGEKLNQFFNNQNV